MPFVNVQTIKGIMTAEQKSELLRRMTDLLVEIEGQGDPQFRQSVWIRIDEHDPEQWSLGGVQPTAAMIAAKFAVAPRGEICRRAARRIPGIKRAAKPGPAI
ncbi:hypothetical protein NUKP39_12990 [Klebsiella variicola]|nr:hypothetical protein NUKP39_12990 [Klebsiella variicola]